MTGKVYTIDEIRHIVTPIAAEYGVDRVYLFGSYAAMKQPLKVISISVLTVEQYRIYSSWADCTAIWRMLLGRRSIC